MPSIHMSITATVTPNSNKNQYDSNMINNVNKVDYYCCVVMMYDV